MLQPQQIEVDALWKTDGKQRFRNTRCAECSSNTKVGSWLRSAYTTNITIRKWFEATSCLTIEDKPIKMTWEMLQPTPGHNVELQAPSATPPALQDTGNNTKRSRSDNSHIAVTAETKNRQILPRSFWWNSEKTHLLWIKQNLMLKESEQKGTRAGSMSYV